MKWFSLRFRNKCRGFYCVFGCKDFEKIENVPGTGGFGSCFAMLWSWDGVPLLRVLII